MEQMPVFVKIDDYNSVLDLMKAIQRKMDEAKETLAKINELKNEEDTRLRCGKILWLRLRKR